MARTKTTVGQPLWQPGGTKEDSLFREGNGHLSLAYKEEEELKIYLSSTNKLITNWREYITLQSRTKKQMHFQYESYSFEMTR